VNIIPRYSKCEFGVKITRHRKSPDVTIRAGFFKGVLEIRFGSLELKILGKDNNGVCV